MNDDFDDNDPDMDDANFDDFDNENQSLGGVFKDSPAAKIAAIAAGVILVFAVIIFLGREKDGIDPSFVGGGAGDFSAPPGTEAASQEYIDAIEEVNERDVEIAQQTGGSALPTPIDPSTDVLQVPADDGPQEDPLERWRRLQQERLDRELQQAQVIEPTVVPDDSARRDLIAQLAELMATQMQAILDSRQNPINYTSISSPEQFREDEEDEDGDNDFDDLEEQVIEEVLLPAGEIEYAQLLIEANTDAPGPVLAQIMSGPLKGSRIIGSFSEQRDFLTLTFSTLVMGDETLSINAIALDPATTLPGVATEVDRRYLSRIALPAAAAFITEFTATLAETARTTVSVDGDVVTEEVTEADTDEAVAAGISSAGETLGEFIEEEADSIQPMIRVAQGTAMGILFLAPVTTQDDSI